MVLTLRPRGRWLVGAATLLALVAVAAAAVAVLSGPPGSVADEPSDPLRGPDYYASWSAVCGLLTSDDLAFAMGWSFADGIQPGLADPAFAGMTGITKCLYRSEEEGVAPVNLGIVYAYADRVFADTITRLEATGEVEQIPELGERAVWTDQPKQLLVRSEDLVIAVNVPVQLRDGEDLELARRLVATIMERLR